jgi:hypothetical protein
VVSTHVVGLSEFHAAFVKVGAQADQAAHASVQDGTKFFLNRAQGGFEGSHQRGQTHTGGDKPNVVTGNLRRSLKSQGVEHIGMGEWSGSAGPTMAYARRVELGAKGPDSLGRNMNSRAFPYVQPAYDALQKELPRIVAANWTKYVI